MQVISIVAALVVFGMWAFSVFSLLFELRRRAVARTDRQWPGPRAALHELSLWAGDPGNRTARQRLIWMTVSVLALGISMSVTLDPPPA